MTTAPLAGPMDALKAAVEFTRKDLGPKGANYPHVRTLLAFAEASLASPLPAEAAPKGVSVGVRRERDRYKSGLETLSTTFYKDDQYQDYAKHVLGTAALTQEATPAAGDMADLIARPKRVQAAFEVWRSHPETGPNASALFEHIEALEASIASQQAEIERLSGIESESQEGVEIVGELKAEVASLSARLVDVTLQRDQWEHACRASMADAEPAVRRAEAAEAKLAGAGKALEPFARNAAAGDGTGPFEVPDGHAARFHDTDNPSKPTLFEGDFRRARTVHASIREAQ